MQVKVAQENNILDITRFLIDEFHGSYIDTFPKVDFDKTLLYVCRHVIEGVVFFIEKDHKIIGVIAGIEAEYWYSKEKFISEGFDSYAESPVEMMLREKIGSLSLMV